jgi:predicted lipid-binding transport protein (Tim44 family)
LFVQYQHDWTTKDFKNIKQYSVESFFSKQKDIFILNFRDNFDIVYNPKLLEAAPISYKQEQDKYIFRVQINAEMVNFELSPQGYVLSGEPEPRSFSEYWEIGLDSEHKWYLMGIRQI